MKAAGVGSSGPQEAPATSAGVPLHGRDYAAACLYAVASLAVYVWTLGPTVTGEDSGELIAAAYTLGIPHPPGYPTWTMLAHAFTWLPFGNVAWRVNLMSAVFAALTVAVTYLLARKLSLPRWASTAAAMAFAFSRELWEQAVIAEVYTLNAFFFAACVLLLFLWQEGGRKSALLALAALYGVSLGNHNTMALVGPCFALYLLYIDRKPWLRWRLYGGAAVVALLSAALVHLYLPIRSAANPPVDWGNPETWESFWAVVTRSQYSFMFTEEPRSLGRMTRQTWELAKNYGQQFSPWMGVVALPGLALLTVRSGSRGRFLLLLLVWVTLGYLVLLNTKLEPESLWISTVFYIPSWLLVSLAMAASLAAVAGQLARFSPLVARVSPAVMVAVAALSPLLWNYRHNDRSQYFYADDFGRNILATLEPDALYFPTADHATFPVLYLQAVEGMRPDVFVGNKYGYPEPALYRDVPELMGIVGMPDREQTRRIEDHHIVAAKRPVYFSAPRSMAGLSGYSLVEEGLVFHVRKEGDAPAPRDYWSGLTWRNEQTRHPVGELTADYIVTDRLVMQARVRLKEGAVADAEALFGQAASIAEGNKEVLNNIGSALAQAGQTEQGAEYFKQAIALDADYTACRLNLAKTYITAGEHANALLELEAVLERDNRNMEALRLSADSLLAIQWYDEAVQRLEYLVGLAPRAADALAQLGDLYLEVRKNPVLAAHYYGRSLEANPDQADIQRKLAELQTPRLPEAPASPTPQQTLPGVALPQLPSAAPIQPDIPIPVTPGFR